MANDFLRAYLAAQRQAPINAPTRLQEGGGPTLPGWPGWPWEQPPPPPRPPMDIFDAPPVAWFESGPNQRPSEMPNPPLPNYNPSPYTPNPYQPWPLPPAGPPLEEHPDPPPDVWDWQSQPPGEQYRYRVPAQAGAVTRSPLLDFVRLMFR